MEKWNAVWLCVVKEKPNLIHSTFVANQNKMQLNHFVTNAVKRLKNPLHLNVWVLTNQIKTLIEKFIIITPRISAWKIEPKFHWKP